MLDDREEAEVRQTMMDPMVQPDQRPTILFFPGVGGDDPEIEDLRRLVETGLDLVTVDYPGAGARGALLSSMRLTADVVTADVLRLRPEGPIALAGYSFGGSLALEVAHLLAEAGRSVDYLAVLDAPFRMEELKGLFEQLRLATAPRQALKKVVQAAANADMTLNLMTRVSAPSVLGLNRSEPVRRALLTHLRTKALAGWTPQPCTSRGVLISTGVLGEENRKRWLMLCPNLVHVPVESDHERLLTGEALEGVAAAMLSSTRGLRTTEVRESVMNGQG